MNNILSSYIEEHKRTIDRNFPDLPTAQKMDKLTEMIGKDFKFIAKTIATNAHKQFAKDVKKLRGDLERLRSGKKLSKKEQLQRQAIACWVKLVNLQLQKIKKGNGII